MARGQSGKQLVTFAVAATVSAIGIGTIYLPFMADRDKLRGLFEEGEEQIPEGARREIRDIMRKEAMEKKAQQEEGVSVQQEKKGAGSMWSSFRRNQ
ncbi:hypothetical protein ACHAWO_008077 [Cyclotella atomus]|jgi:hypothetical protein|uniref:Uncharacterized protein n=1 Tax=Cyclotella atomus TaxID=382360 RepID=A0ABD3NVL7_9STRA